MDVVSLLAVVAVVASVSLGLWAVFIWFVNIDARGASDGTDA